MSQHVHYHDILVFKLSLCTGILIVSLFWCYCSLSYNFLPEKYDQVNLHIYNVTFILHHRKIIKIITKIFQFPYPSQEQLHSYSSS